LQAHLKTSPANAKPKFSKELAKPAQEKNFKIFLPLFKKNKTQQHTDDTDRKEKINILPRLIE